MEAFEEADASLFRNVGFVLTDVDDTLTSGGRLRAGTIDALERLERARIKVVPVTGASAGWCNLMMHMWPVEAVIGENGGLTFQRDAKGRVFAKRYVPDGDWRNRLEHVRQRLVAAFPNLQLADDQPYRETCLAFQRADAGLNEKVIAMAHRLGASATLNSLWILCWLGNYDKLATVRLLFGERYGVGVDQLRQCVLYVGDSQNDEPMFRFFPNSVGVSTVTDHPLRHWPRWITRGGGGGGFVEVAEKLLASR